jgi:hypothetical protein
MFEEKFWDDTLQTIRKWRKLHPPHAPKLHMIERKIQAMRIEYMKNIQDYYYRKHKSKLEQAEKIKQEAEELLKKLSKFEFLATLSK